MPSYNGALDRVSNRIVGGWAWDVTSPARHVKVTVLVNDEEIGTTVADRFRQDLAESGIGDGLYSFELVIPERIQRIYHVEVIADGGEFRLQPSNPTVIAEDSNHPLPEFWKGEAGRFRLPSFFILGAAKCGTTSLHAYLDKHPDIVMSSPKEPFFFEAEYDYGPTFYFNKYFNRWRGESVVGEARHRNLYLPFVPARIYAHNPDAKLIVILRNPAERAVSHWWHWFSRNMEALSLRKALLADWERIRSGACLANADEIDRYARTLDLQGKGIYRTYVDSGYYYDQLTRYIRLFGRERLHILLFEDLVHNPRDAVTQIFKLLDVDPACARWMDYEVFNRSESGMQDHVDQATAEWLIAHYRQHNRKLEDLLHCKLDAWDSLFDS